MNERRSENTGFMRVENCIITTGEDTPDERAKYRRWLEDMDEERRAIWLPRIPEWAREALS
jgi:hypothetical protein